MDRLYFTLVRDAIEVAGLCNSLATNANYRKDVDEATQPSLHSLCDAMFHVKTLLYHAVGRQMANDPQQREIDISHEVHDNH